MTGHSLEVHAFWVLGLTALALPIFTLLIMYPCVVRPLDKRLPPMDQYLMERGVPYLSLMFRLGGYVLGVILQPYRGKGKRGLLGRLTRGRFEYQDAVYGAKVNFRHYLNRYQIWLCNFFAWYVMVAFLIAILSPIIFKGLLQKQTL